MSIKTLHITNCYHASSGGIRTFYRALLDAADQHRREVRLIIPGAEDSIEEVGAFGRIYTIQAPKSPLIDARYRLLLPHLYALPFRSRLRKILYEECPDLVEVCDKYTLCYLPSVLRKIWDECAPQAVFVGLSCERMDDNVSAYFTDGALGRRFSNWYMKRIYAPRFDCHISNSRYTAGELTAALSKRPDLPVHVCPMGTDCENFGPHRRDETKRKTLLDVFHDPAGRSERTKLLVYVGRISREKNTPLLLQLMTRLVEDSDFDYRLVIVGTGPLAERMEEEAERKMSGRVRFIGYVADRGRIADIIANCDAMIHPNPREPFGIAPLEAMASGLPVVAPVSGGVLSYADDRNCWLAEPDGENFARAVRRIFADEDGRQFKVSRAMDTAREFSWGRTTERFFNLYDDLHARFRTGDSVGTQIFEHILNG